MFKQVITITVIACFLFHTGCAPVINEIQVKDSEYDEIKGVEKILVETKEGKQHEVVRFQFTETHLVGIELVPNAMAKSIEISLADIESVKIKGIRDKQGEIITEEEIEQNSTKVNRTGGAFLGGLGLGVLAFVPSCAFSWSVAGESGENEDLATLLFFGLEIGAIVAGGYLGYKGGKNSDQRKAIEKIEKKRESERKKDTKN